MIEYLRAEGGEIFPTVFPEFSRDHVYNLYDILGRSGELFLIECARDDIDNNHKTMLH